MDVLLLDLIHWASGHPAWAGVLVAVIACAESLAFVGLVFPGALMMLGAGALVGAGVLDFWSIYAWSVAGAVLGDGVSYWLGHTHKEYLLGLRFIQARPQLLEGGTAFFAKHGGKSVLLARFVGPVRPVLPLVAGMLGMPPRRFYLYNVLSALFWAPAYLIPGMAFGASLALAGEVAGRLALLLGVILVFIWLLIRLAHPLYRWLHAHARTLLNLFWNWAGRHPRLLPSAGAVFLVLLAWQGWGRLAADHAHPDLPARPHSVPVAVWWEAAWQQLPAHRQGREGEAKQPLNLQWAGELSQLRQTLQHAGWHPPLELTPRTALRWLLPDPTLDDLPTLPQWHANQPAALALVYDGDAAHHGTRLILRVWPSGVVASGGPIWLGSVTWQRLERLPLLRFPRDAGGEDQALARLRPALTHLHGRLVRRQGRGAGATLLVTRDDPRGGVPGMAPGNERR